MSRKKGKILIIIGIVLFVLKVIALVDVYKKRALMSRKKVFFLTTMLIFFPPTAIFYLIYANLPREEGDADYDSVNLNVGL